MIKGRNIICISYTTWEGEYTKSTVKLLSLLALNNNVVFIEYPRTIKDLSKGIFGNEKIPVSRMLGFEKRVKTIVADTGAKIKHVVMPAVLPTASIKNESLLTRLYNWNTNIYKKELLKIQKQYNLQNPIVITAFNPVYGLALIGELNEDKNIYYCYDGMDLNRNNQETINREKEFCKLVDGIITTSDYLNDEKKQLNSKSYVVKNGVDYELFKPFSRTTVNQNKVKKVGYTGSLDYRFDIELVEYAVQELPDVIFEFTGGVLNQKVVDSLSKYKNVVFNSAVHASIVPQIVSKFDVGIIPYVKSEINKNIYPLKINEYLAIGVPVIMTQFAVLNDFKNIASVTNTKEEFVKQIKYQINNDSENLIKERIDFAKSNSWDKRVELFSSYLNQFVQ
jgi:glycosyltransferase involved in cell wall biosynthesis